MNLMWLLFSFKGRINRQPYWLFTLCTVALILIGSLLLSIDITKRGGMKSLVLGLFFLWPSLSVQAKRWHDRNKSAWWLLINIVPIVGPIWALIENGCLPGTSGENRYGKDPAGNSSNEPTTEENKPLRGIMPAYEWKPKKYYISTLMMIMMIFIVIMILLSTVILAFIIKYTSMEFPGGIIPFLIMDAIIIGVIIWRIMTPLIEISDTGLKVGVPFLFRKNTAMWDEIDAMVIGQARTVGIKERDVKILLKSGNASTKELYFKLNAVEKADEIVEKLRAKIPEKAYEAIKQSSALQKPVTKKEIRYRGWILTEKGLRKGKEIIPWEKVKELKCAGLVIAGYGATTIIYTGNGGRIQSITAKSSSSEQYQDFIRYLMQHSQKATIDPSLLSALEYSPKDAKADMLSILLFVTGIILLFILGGVITYYSTGIYIGSIALMLYAPFTLIPMIMTMKLLVGRFRGKTEPSSKKILWSSLFNVGQVVSVLVLFVISPFSFYWMAGDLAVKLKAFDRAEGYYQSALHRIPNNIDALFEMGSLYREKKDYDKAVDYLTRAYTRNPSWWGPDGVVLLPDTLLKMGKHKEALKWCEQILKDRPNKIDIQKAISKKQDEIIREMDFSQKNGHK